MRWMGASSRPLLRSGAPVPRLVMTPCTAPTVGSDRRSVSPAAIPSGSTAASGLQSSTNGAPVAATPRFCPAPNPGFVGSWRTSAPNVWATSPEPSVPWSTTTTCPTPARACTCSTHTAIVSRFPYATTTTSSAGAAAVTSPSHAGAGATARGTGAPPTRDADPAPRARRGRRVVAGGRNRRPASAPLGSRRRGPACRSRRPRAERGRVVDATDRGVHRAAHHLTGADGEVDVPCIAATLARRRAVPVGPVEPATQLVERARRAAGRLLGPLAREHRRRERDARVDPQGLEQPPERTRVEPRVAVEEADERSGPRPRAEVAAAAHAEVGRAADQGDALSSTVAAGSEPLSTTMTRAATSR